MYEREYLRLKKEIEDRCRKDLEALERVWQLSKRDEPDNKIKRGDLQNAIVRVVSELKQDFTAEQVLARLKTAAPEIGEKTKASTVSSALKRMHENGEIDAVIRGIGRKPSVYRLKKSELAGVAT